MNRALAFFSFLFNLLAMTGEVIIHRPGKWLYILLLILAMISHLTALLILISVLCYAYRRSRHAVF